MTNKEAAIEFAKAMKKNKALREVHKRMDEEWKKQKALKSLSARS